MSTYLPNSQDYIPQIQPFNPDLNFYASVLATKQHQYDQGLSKLGSIYSSAFNSPMSATDNIQRRDNYLKTIEQQIKKTAQLDLSIDQNVNSAKTLFDPIINDKDIVNDIVYTKGVGNAYQNGENFRFCTDAEKCSGEFWQEGLDAIQYSVEEFQKASPAERLRLKSPEYVPFQNVTKLAMKAAKDAGFNPSYEYVDGRYNITDTNGYLLLDKQNKDGSISKGVLPQFLYGTFGNNSAIQKMYKTQAFLERKNYAKMNAGKFDGNEALAESEYLQSIMMQVTPKLNESKEDLNNLRNQTSTDMKALDYYGKENGFSPGDGIEEAYDKLQGIMDKTEPAVQFHDQVSNLINTAPNLNNLRAMQDRVDGIVAKSKFVNTIDAAAYDYAMATAKHEIKADPYALSSFNNALDLNKAKQLKMMDHELWLDHQTRLGNIGGTAQQSPQDAFNYALSKGITPDQMAAEGIDMSNINTPANHAKLLKLGITIGDQEAVANTFVTSGGENYKDTYIENSKIKASAIDNADKMSSLFVKDTFKAMQAEYKKAANSADTGKAKVIQDKIMADATNMLKGTNLNPTEILFGDKSLNVLDAHPKLGEMTAFALESRKKDKSGLIYNSGWSDENVMKVQLANQTAQGLLKEGDLVMKNAVDDVIHSIPYEGDESKFIREGAKYSALLGPGHTMLTKEKAIVKYTNSIKGQFDNSLVGQARWGAAMLDYATNYDDYRDRFVSKLKALDSKAGSQDQGGSTAVGKSVEKSISGDEKFSSNFINFQKGAKEIRNNQNSLPITILSGNSKDLNDLSQNSATTTFANQVLDKVISGQTAGMKLNTQYQYLPQNDKASITVNVMDDKTVKTLRGLKASDVITEDMRSFIMVVPPGLNISDDFLNKVKPNPSDVLLQNTGQSLSVDFPNKGTGTIVNKNGQLYGQGNYLKFNNNTGVYELSNLPDQVLPQVSVDDAFKIIKSKIDDLYLLNKQKELDFKNNKQQNARTEKIQQ